MSGRTRFFFQFAIGFLLSITAAAATAQERPLPAKLAAEQMTLPPGFKATLFAGEPDVVQPISFTFDDRGRLWVVESYAYPGWANKTKDRVLIFEDTDGDGHFDKRTVFWDQGLNLTSIEIGFDGVWLCSLPNLIFVPDRNGDDVPDGPPEVLLDGWSIDGKHNAVSSLTWGPDGWLYGCQGILSLSRVGKPGTPDAERAPINCGVWRYHPTRHVFEVVAHGTTNPWGLDFDAAGEAFITNCVINHLWHVVPGVDLQRMFGQDYNPHLYGLMSSCADHLHWAGGPWNESGGNQPKHSDAGGGHAHVGAMVYLGDNWPDEYRGKIFMCNLHGSRVNEDIFARKGSGYVAHHGHDFLKSGDPWFRGLKLQYGPDGGVFLSDWSDTGECHNYQKVDRESGRIFKIIYGTPQRKTESVPALNLATLDLAKLTDAQLVELQRHKNEWFARHARRLLQERAAAGRDLTAVQKQLRAMLADEKDEMLHLRALWALRAVDGLDEAALLALLDHPDESTRGWAVRLLAETPPSPKVLSKFAETATRDSSPKVRLAIAAAMQRVPDETSRLPVLTALARHGDDASDANLPLMIWYALEPCAARNPADALKLLESAKIPLLREYLARRVANLVASDAKSPGACSQAAQPDLNLQLLIDALSHAADPAVRLDVLQGMHAALEGRSRLRTPGNWKPVYEKLVATGDPAVRERARQLALIFGDAPAADALRTLAADAHAPEGERRRAIESLVQVRDPQTAGVLIGLLADGAARGAALRGLGAYDDAAIPVAILKHYQQFTTDEKQTALGTLVSRPAYALALLASMEQKKIPATDISIYNVRQLSALQVPEITKKLEDVWGAVRTTPAEKLTLIRKYRGQLDPGTLVRADRPHGRAVFTRVCATCHKLFGEGAEIGPDLTGSQRANLDYVLQNVVDPSAIVGRDYRMTLITTDDGRLITGIIKKETESSLSIQTPTQLIVLAKADIADRKQSMISMMPEGLLENLKPVEVSDLVAYLASPSQVPLPPAGGTKGN